MMETEDTAEEETSGFATDATIGTVKDESTTGNESSAVEERIVSDNDTRRGAKQRTRIEEIRKKKREAWTAKCRNERWTREGESLWRLYMKLYGELRRKSAKEEDVAQRKIPDVPRLPRAEVFEETLPPYECFPLSGFRHMSQVESSEQCRRKRIWKSMKSRRSINLLKRERDKLLRTGSSEWPGVWPCTTRDLMSVLKEREMKGRRKRRDVFPCDPQADDEDELRLQEQRSYFANRKELGHVRAPVICQESEDLLVDRAAGERPGLVDGDYVIVELASSEGRENDDRHRIYANVVLRGLKGMHLPELSPLRERRGTWKFCFYQALVALLAKTQLRYKYAWGANIDYIYDHAWTLYTHIGAINVKEKQLFDDIVVYNYKYNIEVELIKEMKDVPTARGVEQHYVESGLRRQITLRRKDPLRVRVELGCRKVTDGGCKSVHEDTREIEEWLNELPARYRNCIFRTTRFSLAFWQDGLFWYLYNPYRCDEFGFWDDDGRACIVKFCTKDSLHRHLMILLLRAYAYEVPVDPARPWTDRHTFDLQIFHVTFHCCRLHNLKLLQRVAPKPSGPPYVGDEDAIDCKEDEDDDLEDTRRERSSWLQRFRITWSKCPAACRKRRPTKVDGGKPRWHHYYVEEFNRLFSLWGEIHITDVMFDEANRGMQVYACYTVCAGMARIMAPEYWSSRILDVIVMCGDRYYTDSKLEAKRKSAENEYAHVSCWSKYLTSCFRIGETLFESKMLPSICGRLYARSKECLWRSLEQMFAEQPFGVLTCEIACLGLFKFCGAYYMCDVNSLGPPLFQYGRGAAYLLRATSFRKFMTVLVSTVGSSECSRFSLNPIAILRVVEVGPTFGYRSSMDEKKKRIGRLPREVHAFNERKKGRRKRRAQKVANDRTTEDALCDE